MRFRLLRPHQPLPVGKACRRGKGYSPPDGRYFTAKVRKLSADRLEVKGCVAVFCKTQVWPRYN
ncbi:DUF2147 domain-containing protein [Pseudoblastomonas flavescens]|uniref:DUF2147 domain-containing protein n=1 Tax=Alteriqipengyuania flavescens TaxID=3053610 RepID=UPI00384CAC0D